MATANNVSQAVEEAYRSIGVANPDAEGRAYWEGQLASGAISPEAFRNTFLTAASGVQDPALATNVQQARQLLNQDVVKQAYNSIGITNPDAEGLNYWTSQLASGAIKPSDFNNTFLNAARGVTDPAYADAVRRANELLGYTVTGGATNTGTGTNQDVSVGGDTGSLLNRVIIQPAEIAPGTVPQMPTQMISPSPVNVGGALVPEYTAIPVGVNPLAVPQINMRNLINQGVVPRYVAMPKSTADMQFEPIFTIGDRIF